MKLDILTNIKADSRGGLLPIHVRNSEFVAGNSSTYIQKYDIVTISGNTGTYMTVERAQDGVTDETDLAVALTEMRERGGVITTGPVRVEGVDTSGSAVGDAVYLSETTAGGWTLSAAESDPVRVGKVLAVSATEGVILLWPRV